MADLTAKQEMFCREFMKDNNGTQAAIRAGYSPKTARQMATENLSKPSIQERIQELKAKKVKQVTVTIHDLVAFWLDMMENAEHERNRLIASENLAKYLGAFEADNRQKGSSIADVARKFLEDGDA